MSPHLKLGLASAGKHFRKHFDAAFLFLPFASLHPLSLYISLATSLTIYRDPSTLRQVLLWHTFLLVNLLKTVYLCLFLPANPLDRVRLADIVYIATGENFNYQIWILLQVMLLYFHYLLLTVKPVFLGFLENLLFNKAHPFLTGVSQKSRSPRKNCQQCALWSLNAFGLLKIICDILILIVGATIALEAIHHPGYFLGNPLVSPHIFAWRILQITVGFTGLFLSLFLYATVCPNIAALGCATLLLFFLRLHLNATRLTALKAHLTWTKMAPYRAHNLQTFSLLFTVNQVFGRIFVAFLAVNLPISAFCFVNLALGELKLTKILTFSLVLLQGLICTLLLHWFMARLTKRLHAPSKPLLALSSLTSVHGKGNFRARLTLHLDICSLHTDRKYGVTYGSFGLVTVGSFSKCMIIYSELIMYSYKLIKCI